jgi:hypothetical protein
MGTLLLVGCASDQGAPEPPSAPALIDSAIAAHGGSVLDRAAVTFRFRSDTFRVRRDDGRFRYTRTYTDSLGRPVREVLSNDSLYRVVDGRRAALDDEGRSDVRTAVNSVVYFALLPYFLDAPAVQAAYDGRDTVRGVPYHRVRVTFREEGGGQDHQDRFVYWFRADSTYAMDYLAYAYGLGAGEEPGTRFRAAFNTRRVAGVRFADYRNLAADTLSPGALGRYAELLEQDALRQVSVVALDSVRVRPLDR